MALKLDHLQHVEPVFREPKFWKLHLNTFAQFFTCGGAVRSMVVVVVVVGVNFVKMPDQVLSLLSA